MIELRPAAATDLALFHALEQDPDTAPYILETTLQQHRDAFARDGITYLSIDEHGRSAGFLIVVSSLALPGGSKSPGKPDR